MLYLFIMVCFKFQKHCGMYVNCNSCKEVILPHYDFFCLIGRDDISLDSKYEATKNSTGMVNLSTDTVEVQ